MDKKLTEADSRSKFITPALVDPHGGNWNLMTQIREEFSLQRRIVAKVDQLLALVDQLEAQLSQSKAIAENSWKPPSPS